MNCKNAQSLLSAFLDEELTGREMLELRTHLNECEACTEELQCVEAVKRMLGGSPVPEPSPDFEERLVSTVMAATRVQTDTKRISILALTGIAAASMLGTMAMLNTIHREPTPLADQNNMMPYELIQRDRAFGASADPLMVSPVLSRR